MTHTASQGQFFSEESHGLFNEKYQSDIQQLFGNLQVLENNVKNYQSIPQRRKKERIKQSIVLFRIYWQNAFRLLLPYLDDENINNQRLFMRYGLLSLEDVSAEDLEALNRIPLDATESSFTFYLDEWMHNIRTEKIVLLSGEEEKSSKKKKTAQEEETQSSNNLAVMREITGLEMVIEQLWLATKSTASPLLQKDDLIRPLHDQIATREAVNKVVSLVRGIDAGVFSRKLLKEELNIDPYLILVPCYADFGTCWEAFDRNERTKSRGRIVIPLYGSNVEKSVLVALANYRWESAKLSSGGYWLEKGLTGGFYDLYRKYKLPGKDEQQAFVAVYCLWILDESRGKIKIHPEVREFFWKEIPFPEDRAKLLCKYFAQFRDIA